MLMKKIPRLFASSLLKITLTGLVLTAALVSVLGSPTGIKEALNDSGVYDTAVSSLLSKSLEENSDQSQADHAAFQQSAQAALTPDTVRSVAEQAVDGVHAWLAGDTATPTFRIDLTEAKGRFITAAGDLAANHVTSLPVCTTAQEREMAASGNETGILDLTCRPRAMTADSARQQVNTQLNDQDFLKDPVLTSDTLLNNKDGKTDSNPLKNQALPGHYQRIGKSPWILLGLAVLLGAAVFFLSDTKRQGAKSVSRTVTVVGATLLLLTFLSGLIFDRLLKPGGPLLKDEGDSLQKSLAAIFNSLSDKFNQTVFKYALAYLIVGGGALLAIKFLWKQPGAVPKTAKKTA